MLPFLALGLLLYVLTRGGEEKAPPAIPARGRAKVLFWRPLVREAITRYPAPGLTLALMLGQIEQESGGNPRAVSSAGAKGLMQLMPATARGYGVRDSFDPAQNIDGGVHLMSDNLRRYRGNVEKALVAYYAGPGVAKRWPNLRDSILAYPRHVLANAKKYEGLE